MRELLIQSNSVTMFGLFKKETAEEKLQKQYDKLIRESFELSRTDRKASDLKAAEAEGVRQQLEAVRAKQSGN